MFLRDWFSNLVMVGWYDFSGFNDWWVNMVGFLKLIELRIFFNVLMMVVFVDYIVFNFC